MTLQCDYHHKLLHEGAFGIVQEEDGALRFVTADGRTIPRNGYRLEDFDDDGIDGGDAGGADASRDAFCSTTVQRNSERAEVRETRAVYRLMRTASVTRRDDAWR
jgi:hypothetical protein